MSDWVSVILDAICQAEDTDEVLSGEEMRAKLDDTETRLRQDTVTKDVFVGSLDAKALYLSLSIKESSKLCGQRVLET